MRQTENGREQEKYLNKCYYSLLYLIFNFIIY